MEYEMANINTVISISILLFTFVFQKHYKPFRDSLSILSCSSCLYERLWYQVQMPYKLLMP